VQGDSHRFATAVLAEAARFRLPGREPRQAGPDRGTVLPIASGGRQKALPHEWRSTGSGAPRGNTNAPWHGFYTRQALAERQQVRKAKRQSRELLQKMK